MDKHGLVIGKFWPPHRGHKYLIDTAQAQVECLDIILCHKPEQVPGGQLRGQWLREIHPRARVWVVDDTLPDDDSAGWAEFCLKLLGKRPDVVFTSEDYGGPFARHLGCRHYQVDKDRRAVPCSGTAVRADPLGWWDFLEPCVRAYYARRICVVGAESTGTTTLAQDLAGYYKTLWVPEYGREYSAEKMARPDSQEWTSPEFEHIAAEQNRREDAAARLCNRVLICDTDAFATGIWHQRYLGFRSPEVDRLWHGRPYALYLLTDVNIPFVQDGTRDGENIRHWMHKVFIEELNANKKPWALLSGPPEERLRQAVELVEAVIKNQALVLCQVDKT